MTEGVSPSSTPSIARGGLQQVTGEMRKALQRMVFSSESQPVFLESIPEIESVSQKRSHADQTQLSTSSKIEHKRVPFTSPNAWEDEPRSGDLGYIHPPHQRDMVESDRRRKLKSGSSPSDFVAPAVPTSSTASSVVPTSEPMTMLQPDESTQSTPQKKNVSVSGTTAVRPKKSRGRSPTVAPMALMGQSDVGVFLQPKSKPAEQEESISKPQPQSADSVDSEADVFMVDPTEIY